MKKNIIKGDYKHSSELMGNISFDNVWFGYNNERFILKGLPKRLIEEKSLVL